jgi:hypothetical protein
MTQHPTQTVTGEVEATNEKGCKVDGRWFNYSQFRDVRRPEVGQTVALEVVRDRFITALTVLTPGGGLEAAPDDGSDPDDAGLDTAPLPTLPVAPARSDNPGPRSLDAPRSVAAARAPAGGRSREEVRATCALAAATWAQGRADVDVQDLIGIAELLHTWVTDPED